MEKTSLSSHNFSYIKHLTCPQLVLAYVKKVKITNSDQSHQSYTKIQSRTNMGSWKHQGWGQVSRSDSHLPFTSQCCNITGHAHREPSKRSNSYLKSYYKVYNFALAFH